MVEEQLIPRGIDAPAVLRAFSAVPRHHFVPDAYAPGSYCDHPLPIGFGQTISQPYMVAVMTQVLDLKGDGKVLEIGTGSGYQAAILAKICRHVYTIEKDINLHESAERVLRKEGYSSITLKHGDGTNGWPEQAPFDGIIVTAASPDIPEPLKEQLADGGRMTIPVGSMYSQMLVLVKKRGQEFFTENICGCVFVPLVGDHGWSES